MQDLPTALDLLSSARETFKQILPSIDPEQRYPALMVANALGIVIREMDAGRAPAQREHACLARLYQEPQPRPPEYGNDEAVLRYNQRLAADIRQGRFDAAEQRAALHDALAELTREKLAIAKPKALKGTGLN